MPNQTPVDEQEFRALLSRYDDVLRSGGTADEIIADIPLNSQQLEMLRLLDVIHASSGDLAALSTAESTSELPPDEPSSDGDEIPGGSHLRFGRFLIRERIGAGGHAVVFRAYDPKNGMDIALKLPKPEALTSAGMRQRFLTEASWTEKLQHPNIVSIHEVGEVDHVCFIAMELCRKQGLAEWIVENASTAHVPDEQVIVHCFSGIVAAVAYAHENGVIHRDIKPGNVVFRRDSAGTAASDSETAIAEMLVPCLTDFGIAKVFQEDSSLTRTGAVIGTPQYMSPEQAGGFSDRIGEASDIYSLGVVLYEMLTGRVPILGSTQLDTLRQIREFEAPPVSLRRPDISSQLETICHKCLEKDPRLRYQSAAALADDVDRFRTGRPILARRSGRIGQRLRAWQRSGRLIPVIGAMIALVAVALYMFWPDNETVEVSRDSVVAEANATANRLAPSVALQTRQNRRLKYVHDMQQIWSLWSKVSLLQGDNESGSVLPQALSYHIASEGLDDTRGFEWYYLWQQTHPGSIGEALTAQPQLLGHRRDIYSVAFSPRDRTIATGGMDSTVRIWDSTTGNQIDSYHRHQNDVGHVEFSPDGTRLATGCDDGTVHVWDTETGECQSTLESVHGWVCSLDYSVSGEQLGIGHQDGTVTIWQPNADDTNPIHLQDHDKRVQGLAWSPDGSVLATSADDGQLLIREAAELNQLIRISLSDERESHECGPMSFSSDGRILALADYILPLSDPLSIDKANIENRIRVFDVKTGSQLTELFGHSGRIRSLEFVPHDGERPYELLSTGDDGRLLQWDVATGISWEPVAGHAIRSWDLAVSADSTRVATAGSDGKGLVYQCAPGSVLHLDTRFATLPTVSPFLCAVSPDGGLLAEASDRESQPGYCKLRLWDIRSYPPRMLQGMVTEEVSSLQFCTQRDGLSVTKRTSSRSGHSLRFLGLDQMDEIGEAQARIDTETLHHVHLSPDERALYCLERLPGSEHVSISARDSSTGVTLHTISCRPVYQARVLPSPDGRLLATVREHSVELLNARSFERTIDIVVPTEYVYSLAFTPDSGTLAIGRARGGIEFRSTATGQLDRTLSIKWARHVDSMAYSPDGRTFAAYGGTELTLFSVPEYRLIGSLPLPQGTGHLTDLRFGGDSRTLTAICHGDDGKSQLVHWAGSSPQAEAVGDTDLPLNDL